MVIFLALLMFVDGVYDCRFGAVEWTWGVGVCVKVRMMVMDEVGGPCRKQKFHLNWSNEVKNNGTDGGMHGKEWRR